MNYSTDHPFAMFDVLPNSDIPHYGYLLESELIVFGMIIAALSLLIGGGTALTHRYQHGTKKRRRLAFIVVTVIISLTTTYAVDLTIRYITAQDYLNDHYTPVTSSNVNNLDLLRALITNDTIVPTTLYDDAPYKGGVEVVNADEVNLYRNAGAYMVPVQK